MKFSMYRFWCLLTVCALLAACGNTTGATPTADHKLNPHATSSSNVILTPSTMDTPAPLGTLPVSPTNTPSATHDPSQPFPDASLFSRMIYTYTFGIKPVKLILDLASDGQATGKFGATRKAGALAPEKLIEIRAALQSSNYFTLLDQYLPARQCCDLPSHEFTLFMPDGQSKTIYILGSAPDPLSPLTHALSGVVKNLPTVP